MGLEYISQPQVFLQPITAVGGIQNGLFGSVLPPLYTSFYTWTSTSNVSATIFPLGGTETITDRSGSYIVTVGGVVQSPATYNIEVSSRSIVFDTPVNENTPVLITQIGTIATSALNVSELTATNSIFTDGVFTNVTTTNLNILSSVKGSYIEISDSLLTNVTATNLRVLSSEFFGSTVFQDVTATRLTVLSSTVTVQSTTITPTSAIQLTAVNESIFFGSISATDFIATDNDLSAIQGSVFVSGGNSNIWNNTTSLFQANSSDWSSTYQAVCSLSAVWVTNSDLIPTVSTYLSTSNVLISGLRITDNIAITSSNVFTKSTFDNLVSALAIQINGSTLYLPLLSAI